MSKPAVLVRVSTGEILKRAPYPRPDMEPVSGLDPDLEWLVVTDLGQPDYDPRYYVLTRSEARGGPHPDHPHLNTWEITWGTQKRQVEEIANIIENRDRTELKRHLTDEQRDKILLLGLGVIFRAASGLSLTTKEQAVKDKILTIAQKVWQNDEHLRALITQVENNQEPDIDDGWVVAE